MDPVTEITIRRKKPAWQQALRRFFAYPATELAIGVLIIISVALTFVEIAAGEPSPEVTRIEEVNHALTSLFAVELLLRFLAASSSRQFFRTYWLDILAVLPLLRMFRLLRALRFLRVLRLLGVFTRLTSYFPYVVRRGTAEYIIICGLIVVTLIFGTAAMQACENSGNADLDSLSEAFWFSTYSLFAGEPVPGPPQTPGGKIASIFIMFMGVTIFAMMTGTVSAFMVDRLHREGHVVDWGEFSDHIIICGWNRKAEIILREFQAARKKVELAAIVITAFEEEEPEVSDPRLSPRVHFLNDDFTKISALEKAGVARANTCIILSDTSQGRSAQDADARTILAALTVEKLNPGIYTCAELINREYGSHLEMGHVNDYVVADDHSAFLLAQAALNRGLMEVFEELLTHEHGNQFYRLLVPDEWIGKPFTELFIHLKETENAILVAVQDASRQSHVNPRDYTLKRGDSAVVIASEKLSL